MKTVTIVGGNFTANGNFSAYDVTGIDRIHIPGRLMESAGFKKGDTIKFPLYALVIEREFNTLDEAGNPTEDKFTRPQAGSIFTDKSAMIEAYNADRLLTMEAEADYKAQASALGLTQEAINALQAVA